jgi:hypothetical protein
MAIALALMCGIDEEPQPSVVAHWRITMACHVARLWTHAIDNGKWILKGLRRLLIMCDSDLCTSD